MARLLRDRPEYLAAVLDEVKARGPLRAGDLRDGGPRRREPWWSWDDAKVALELLFWTGDVSARRLSNFERDYDLTERRPAGGRARSSRRPSEQESRRELLALSAAGASASPRRATCATTSG